GRVAQGACQLGQFFVTDEAHAECDLLGTSDAESLTLFEGAHEVRRFAQGIRGARVKPSVTATQLLDAQCTHLEIDSVDVGNLDFTAGGRFQPGCDFNHAMIVEIEPGHGPARARGLRFFFNGDRAATFVELNDPVAFRVVDGICEDSGTIFVTRGAPHCPAQIMAEENVVAQNKSGTLAPYEISADEVGLGNSLRPRLL